MIEGEKGKRKQLVEKRKGRTKRKNIKKGLGSKDLESKKKYRRKEVKKGQKLVERKKVVERSFSRKKKGLKV